MSKPGTQISNKANEVGQVARSTATNRWILLLARFGYGAKGVVYLIIGFLATQVVVGAGGATTDQAGALRAIGQQPFGKVLLIIVAIGLLCFAVWSLIQAIFDTDNQGTKAKGIIGRLAFAMTGISYGALAFGAFQLGSGSGSGGKSSTASTQGGTALLLRQPLGQVLVILLGLIVIGVACYFFYRAYKALFLARLNLATLHAQTRKLVINVSKLGHVAFGVVLFVVGIFLIVAALQDNASKAKGLDAALQTLAHQPYGQVVLGIVALGLMAYGVYSFVEARYRRLGRV
jgi:hypothetical protein